MWKWMLVLCVAFSAALSAETKVLAFSGSTREGSLNKKLVLEAANSARQMGAKVTVIDLKDYPLPFYDADLEAKEGMPAKAKQLRQMMIQSDVILIASRNITAPFPERSKIRSTGCQEVKREALRATRLRGRSLPL